MENRWSDGKAAQALAKYGQPWGSDLALGLYAASLIGSEDKLVLHGGGNSSVKTERFTLHGERIDAIYVKASGYNMASIEPDGYAGLDLKNMKKLRAIDTLSDDSMTDEFCANMLDSRSAAPSIETLVHVFIAGKYVDHTHPDAILALSNQVGGEKHLKQALGEKVAVIDYYSPGFKLAKAVAEALDKNPEASAIVLQQHGLITWGETAKESYNATIELSDKAEKYLDAHAQTPLVSAVSTPLSEAEDRYARTAPIIRGLLAASSGNPDDPWSSVILRPLISKEILNFVDSNRGRETALTPPLTSDHLIRTKPFYLWVDDLAFDDLDKFREQLSKAIKNYAAEYDEYIKRNAEFMPAGMTPMDSFPRVIVAPGMGAVCAGKDATAAAIVKDIAAHTLLTKAKIAAMGSYSGLSERDLFLMEYRPLQQVKLQRDKQLPLSRKVALITGAAGAIGSGIAEELLEQGCHVALSDLAGSNLTQFVSEMKAKHGERVIGVPIDITEPQAVAEGFKQIAAAWGGIDLIVLNAGAAHVSALSEMKLETFRKLEKINVEGTLIMLSQAAHHFKLQGIGGDIVIISTKNVFSPGARFGAYSATKAAGHQLGRIASQEFAEMGVRVNMVAPDAVFGNRDRQSGLWAEVGPERMSARGLSPEGLEEYYRNRNLLKARITARHVGRAVLFFATRQTPTTGATIPVDGGLPDSTPR